jgi:hypothetical protein
MYIANYTHPDILFSVNLLAWYSSSLTRRHWNEVKTICFLRGTMDILFKSTIFRINKLCRCKLYVRFS